MHTYLHQPIYPFWSLQPAVSPQGKSGEASKDRGDHSPRFSLKQEDPRPTAEDSYEHRIIEVNIDDYLCNELCGSL